MRKKWVQLVTTAFLSTACASTHVPAPVPSEPPISTTGEKQSSSDTRAQLWEFQFENETHSYSSITRTALQSDQRLSTNTDTSTINTEFSVAINRQQTPLTLSGQLSRFELLAGLRTSAKQQPVRLPLRFTGTIASGQLLLQPLVVQPDSNLCDNPESSYLNELHTAVISLPAHIQAGSTWMDTLSTTTCSGSKIPSTVQIIRAYTVRGNVQEGNKALLLLNRTDQIRLSGTGSQDQHQVQLDGEGSGSSAIFLDPETGTLYKLTATQNVNITLVTSGRSYHFKQEVTQRVSLVP